ncbi:MAG: response regulator [Oligoflexales bacterium]|nr:response regulator [Oligoflexales bacterium]
MDGYFEHILVVDDNIDMLHLISDYLKHEKYSVSLALNGKEALGRSMRRAPDLIIADWMMPVMSGVELLEYMKNDERLASIPFILLTAKSDEASKKVGVCTGADAFLGKPFDREELLSLVKNLLKLKQGERQIASLNREIANGVLRRFMPPQMVEKILKGENVFDSKPKNEKVTVLIAALSHFREYVDDMGPANLSELLNEYYSGMTEIAFSHEGIIDRFEDGCIRVLFGVPTGAAPEIQIGNACRSALAMEQKTLEILPKWNVQSETKLSYKMAVHFGEAVVGTVGSSLKTDYTAIGGMIHFAKIIESFAKDGEILISMDVRDNLGQGMWVRHGQFVIDGSGKKVTLARLVSPVLKEQEK